MWKRNRNRKLAVVSAELKFEHFLQIAWRGLIIDRKRESCFHSIWISVRHQVHPATTVLNSLVAINGLLQSQIVELLNLEHINAPSPPSCREAKMIAQVYHNVWSPNSQGLSEVTMVFWTCRTFTINLFFQPVCACISQHSKTKYFSSGYEVCLMLMVSNKA